MTRAPKAPATDGQVELDTAQALFWRAITWPTGVADFADTHGPAIRDALRASFVSPQPHAAPERTDEEALAAIVERLEVYANAYFWRLHGVLEENHPTVAWCLGSPRFRNLATDYVLAQPSRAADLRTFSHRLPAFLAAHREPRMRALAAVADVECAVGDLLHAPDTKVMASDLLAALSPEDWPQLVLRTVGALRVIDVGTDVLALDALRRQQDPRDAPPAPTEIRDGHESVVVWRRGHKVHRRRCTRDEAFALRTLAEGIAFAELCQAIFERRAQGPTADASQRSLEGVATQCATWLRNWVDAQMLRA